MSPGFVSWEQSGEVLFGGGTDFRPDCFLPGVCGAKKIKEKKKTVFMQMSLVMKNEEYWGKKSEM